MGHSQFIPAAAVSAIAGTHTDEELVYLFDHLEELDLGFLSNSTVRQFLAQLLSKGHLHDEVYLQNRLQNLLGDLTFLEAHEKTGSGGRSRYSYSAAATLAALEKASSSWSGIHMRWIQLLMLVTGPNHK